MLGKGIPGAKRLKCLAPGSAIWANYRLTVELVTETSTQCVVVTWRTVPTRLSGAGRSGDAGQHGHGDESGHRVFMIILVDCI